VFRATPDELGRIAGLWMDNAAGVTAANEVKSLWLDSLKIRAGHVLRESRCSIKGRRGWRSK